MATNKMDTSSHSKNAGETSEFDVYEADLKDDELNLNTNTDDKSCGTNDYEEITVESEEASLVAEEEVEIIEEEIEEEIVEEIVEEEDDNDSDIYTDDEDDDDDNSSANNSSVWEGDLSTPIIINPADIPVEERDFMNTLILCGNENTPGSKRLDYSINFPTSRLGYVTASAEYEASYGENKDEGDIKSKKSSKRTKHHKKKKDALKRKSSKKSLIEEELTESPNPTSNHEAGKVSKRKSSKKKLMEGDIEKVRKQRPGKKKLDKDDDIISTPKRTSTKVKRVKTPKSAKSQKSRKSKEDQDDENDLSLFDLETTPKGMLSLQTIVGSASSFPVMDMLETFGGSTSSFPMLDLLDRKEETVDSMHNCHKSLSYLDNSKSKRKSKRKSTRRASEVIKLSISKDDLEKSPKVEKSLKGQSKKDCLAKNSTHSTTEQRHSKKSPSKSPSKSPPKSPPKSPSKSPSKHVDDSKSTTTKGKKKTPPEDGSPLPAEAPLLPSAPLNPQEFPSLGELLSSQEGKQSSNNINPPSMTSHSASHSSSRSFHSGPAPPSVSSDELKGEQSMNQAHPQQQDADPDEVHSPGSNSRMKKMFASKRRPSYRTHTLMENVDEGEPVLLGGTPGWSPRTPRASLILKKKMGSLRHLISSKQYHGLEGEESSGSL
jgi:hypothetical protein